MGLQNDSLAGKDKYGFSALPVGESYNDKYNGLGNLTNFMTTDIGGSLNDVRVFSLYSSSGYLNDGYKGKFAAFSVRYIKN